MKIRLLTRQSHLALAQSRLVQEALESNFSDISVQLISKSTKADRLVDQSIQSFGGKGGAFTRLLEKDLHNDQGDIAVHSLKDLPFLMSPNLTLAGFMPREQAFDVLVGHKSVLDLPKGSIIGTSSPRRKAQLLRKRKDIVVKAIRGNILTRLKKLNAGEFDALILAKAGLNRLNLSVEVFQLLDHLDFLPAFGQGIIAVQCQSSRKDLISMIQAISDDATVYQAWCERACLGHLGASCLDAVAGYSWYEKDFLCLKAAVYHPVDHRMLVAESRLHLSNMAFKLIADFGKQVAQNLLDQGAAHYLGFIKA